MVLFLRGHPCGFRERDRCSWFLLNGLRVSRFKGSPDPGHIDLWTVAKDLKGDSADHEYKQQ